MAILIRHRRCCAAILCLLIVVNTSCTAMVSVPPSEYSQLDSDEAAVWQITTADGQIFIAKKFFVTDSTLVIQELDFESDKGAKIAQGEAPNQMDLPISINRDAVVSVEKQITEYAAPILIIGIPALVVVFVIVARALGAVVSGGT